MQHKLCSTSKVESNSHKSLHLGIYFTMPGVHSEIGPCKNHAEKFDTWVNHRTIDDWLHTPSNLIICFRTEFCQLWYKNKTSNTKVSIQNVSNHVTTIPIDLKDNNDPFTLNFRFHCYTRFVFVLSHQSHHRTHIQRCALYFTWIPQSSSLKGEIK